MYEYDVEEDGFLDTQRSWSGCLLNRPDRSLYEKRQSLHESHPLRSHLGTVLEQCLAI